MKSCGGCTMCCKLLGIRELAKPMNEWCKHCAKGVGCGIYDTKPESCVEYECLWLASYDQGVVPNIALRPDKSKCVISAGESQEVITVHVDPGNPLAWRKEPVMGFLNSLADKGFKIVIGVGGTREKTLLERMGPGVVATRKIVMSEPDENGVQWYKPEEFHGA